jgi:hypothetical protein
MTCFTFGVAPDTSIPLEKTAISYLSLVTSSHLTHHRRRIVWRATYCITRGSLSSSQPGTCSTTNSLHDQTHQHARSRVCDTQNHESKHCRGFPQRFPRTVKTKIRNTLRELLFTQVVEHHTSVQLLREHPQQSNILRFLNMKCAHHEIKLV